ncbi:MAG TPA: universal stress protein [Myxococcaceae bacterium]|nr:universal stress protein [Myxococcaceae bacterium]
MKRILVGFDGSDQSRRAARLGAEMASATGAAVTLTEVVPQLLIPGDAAGMMTAELMARDHQLAAEHLTAAAAELRAGGRPLEVTTEVLEGSPPAEMARAANEDPEVELVIVGRSGKGAIQRAILGSVASRLAHACTKPVMIV